MTPRETVEAHARRMQALGDVTFRAMFGEWGVRIDGRFAAVIGDGRIFLKVKGVPDPVVDALFGNRNAPYEGARNYAEAAPGRFDDPEWTAAVREALVAAGVLPTAGSPE